VSDENFTTILLVLTKKYFLASNSTEACIVNFLLKNVAGNLPTECPRDFEPAKTAVSRNLSSIHKVEYDPSCCVDCASICDQKSAQSPIDNRAKILNNDANDEKSFVENSLHNDDEHQSIKPAATVHPVAVSIENFPAEGVGVNKSVVSNLSINAENLTNFRQNETIGSIPPLFQETQPEPGSVASTQSSIYYLFASSNESGRNVGVGKESNLTNFATENDTLVEKLLQTKLNTTVDEKIVNFTKVVVNLPATPAAKMQPPPSQDFCLINCSSANQNCTKDASGTKVCLCKTPYYQPPL